MFKRKLFSAMAATALVANMATAQVVEYDVATEVGTAVATLTGLVASVAGFVVLVVLTWKGIKLLRKA